MYCIWWIFLVVIIILCILAYYLWYSGILYKVQVTVKDKPFDGELEIYYKIGIGSHRSCSEFYEEMSQMAPGAMRIGIFYENPKIVKTSNLRWIVGVITAVNGIRLINEFALERLTRYHCRRFIIAQAEKAIVAKYPLKTALSLRLARTRIPEAIDEFQKTSQLAGRPLIELRDHDHITYTSPLQNHNAYTVPEFTD